MSGILKPMVHTTNTIKGVAEPVGLDQIVTMTVGDAVFSGAGGASEYYIDMVVNAAGGQTASNVKWRYADAATRDTDFDALLVLASDAL